MGAIEAVFLDVGWTLAYPRASIWEIFSGLCDTAAARVTPEACEELVRSLWSSGQEQAEREFHNGAQYPDSDEEFAGAFEKMARVIFSYFGVRGDHATLVERFLQAFWTEDNWAIFPEVPETLAALRDRGVRLGVLSNAPSNLPEFLNRLGIDAYLDFTVVSAVEGVKKPDRRIFEVALGRAGVTPQRALHVGDMYLEDIIGGRTAGVQTLLMERGQRALFPHHRESAERALAAEAVVTDLGAVLQRVAES